MGLESCYRGDQDFVEFARRFRELEGATWADWDHRETLIEQCGGDADIAVMIHAAVGGDQALVYLDKPVPALEGETPRACMQNDAGTKRLKVMLTRLVGR